MRKQTFAALGLLAVAALAAGFGAKFAAAQSAGSWFEPGATPPQGNVAAPLNVSSSAQSKLGELDDLFLRGWTYVLSPDSSNDNSGSGNTRAALIFGGSDSTHSGSGAESALVNPAWYLGVINNTVAKNEQFGIFNWNTGTWNQMWSSNGNVGIGGPDVPQTALDVHGQVTIRGGNPQPGYVLTSQDSNGTAAWAPAGSGGTNNGATITYVPPNYAEAYENLGEDEYRAGVGDTQYFAYESQDSNGYSGVFALGTNVNAIQTGYGIACRQLTDANLPTSSWSSGSLVRPVAQQPFLDIKGYDAAPVTPATSDDFGALVDTSGATHQLIYQEGTSYFRGATIPPSVTDLPQYPVDMMSCYNAQNLTDTCDGDNNDTLYQCKPEETRGCIDRYKHDGYDAIATITCNAKKVIETPLAIAPGVTVTYKTFCTPWPDSGVPPCTDVKVLDDFISKATYGIENRPATLQKLCEVGWEPGAIFSSYVPAPAGADSHNQNPAKFASSGGHTLDYWDPASSQWVADSADNWNARLNGGFTCVEVK